MRETNLLMGVVLVLSLLIVGASGSVTAQAEVGFSGNCDENSNPFNEEHDRSSGGGDGVRVNTSSGNDHPNSEGQSQMWLNFVEETSQNEEDQHDDTCDGKHGPGGKDFGDDYFEVHAEAEEHGIQYCISDQNDENGGEVHTKGDDSYNSSDCAYASDGKH